MNESTAGLDGSPPAGRRMNVSGPADWILGGWQAGGSLFLRTIDRWFDVSAFVSSAQCNTVTTQVARSQNSEVRIQESE